MALERTFFELGIASLVVWRVSTTVATAKIFEPFRDWVNPPRSSIRHRRLRLWLHELVSCQFCISHYVAIGYLVFWHPVLVQTGNQVLDFGVLWMSVVGLSSLIARAYQKHPTQPVSGRLSEPLETGPADAPLSRPSYRSEYDPTLARPSGVRRRAS